MQGSYFNWLQRLQTRHSLVQLSDFLRWPSVEDDYRFPWCTKIKTIKKRINMLLTHHSVGEEEARPNGTSQGRAIRDRGLRAGPHSDRSGSDPTRRRSAELPPTPQELREETCLPYLLLPGQLWKVWSVSEPHLCNQTGRGGHCPQLLSGCVTWTSPSTLLPGPVSLSIQHDWQPHNPPRVAED